ncbi:beta-1,4-glucuronyltransferase 1-like [Schistocerca americana]|uniref:beta-1,4-glucuronyltransferase 1-like n=1 Tax=Schistocerca americana TaxID=7009 RepID=UPI001F4F9F95|nr:beta-1,4-glucuronyltransferase 1-like [Schistocerca americana]XP_049947091.1 beta-1,4-glucuronyltransferase 1-like [Schistocerca serialis cubense]
MVKKLFLFTAFLVLSSVLLWSQLFVKQDSFVLDQKNVITEVTACNNTKEENDSGQKDEYYTFIFTPWLGQRDASQKYQVHTFAMIASNWQNMTGQPLCLATHTSVEHLHWLADVATHWCGPISVSIFAPDLDYQIAEAYISYLRQCFSDITSQVSLHIIYPIDFPPINSSDFNEGLRKLIPKTCSFNHQQVLDKMLQKRPQNMFLWREKLPYPQNILRNIARKTCQNQYFVCPDIDMIPTSKVVCDKLNKFLENPKQKSCLKCAYVIPVYEISSNVTRIPYNKTELTKMVKQRNARVFHSNVFWRNQWLSNLSYWENQKESSKMSVSYDAGKYSFWYEPIYVAQTSAPLYDERFIGYGLTRNTQIYEMYLDGWSFKIVNNIFLVHWGFQNRSSQSALRKKQAFDNFAVFKDFLREKSVKYDKDPLNLLQMYEKMNVRIKLQNLNVTESENFILT